MQVEIQLQPGQSEPKVIVVAERITEEVAQLMELIQGAAPQVIAGFQKDRAVLLSHKDIIRIYGGAGKVYALTSSGEFQLRLRLYECEARLDKHRFVRISNSEIVNLEKVRQFDLSFSGTICVTFTDGTSTFVSRRYVSKIKQALGL